LNEEVLDDGTEAFEPSNLEITSVDVGNTATNVIPAEARATFNVRFNDMHTGRTLESRLRLALDSVAARVAASYTLDVTVSGEAFLTEPGPFVDIAVAAITRVTGINPELSTSGGTSDARFIKDVCPVIEFGLPGLTMHKVDERAAVSDLTRLAEIYRAMLDGYFAP
jgi:succinyl-diaminopimelate desuccinylase